MARFWTEKGGRRIEGFREGFWDFFSGSSRRGRREEDRGDKKQSEGKGAKGGNRKGRAKGYG